MDSNLPVDQVVGCYRRNVGRVKIAVVHDGMLSASFNDIVGFDPALGESIYRAVFRKVPPELSCNAFVVKTPRRLTLIDSGCGGAAPRGGKVRAGLAALGIQCGDVDAVLMTHLHRDHAAGLIDADGKAVFPRAELVVHEDELAFWRNEANLDRLRGGQKKDFFIAASVLAAYAARVRPVRSGELVDGILAVAFPGHTPGHMAWLIDSERELLLVWGDIVHLPAIQFTHPEASVTYDLDCAAAAEARGRALDFVAAEKLLVAGVHLDFPCFGRVEKRAGGGYSFTPETWTSAI